jgi:DNA-binding GntR family transcriptional regulator
MPRQSGPARDAGGYTLLRDAVRDEIRAGIIDGRYPPNTRIIERNLAEQLGVSRIPVREALRMLETEGFVTLVPRRGVLVRQLSENDVEELFDVRQALEVLAAERAAERAGKGDILRLRQLLARGRRAIDAGDMSAVWAANEEFHDEIIRLARNGLLAGVLEPLQGRLHWLFRQHENPERLWDEHSELCDAIASGDPQRAAAQALQHVRTNRALALRLLFGAPGGEAPATG